MKYLILAMLLFQGDDFSSAYDAGFETMKGFLNIFATGWGLVGLFVVLSVLISIITALTRNTLLTVRSVQQPPQQDTAGVTYVYNEYKVLNVSAEQKQLTAERKRLTG